MRDCVSIFQRLKLSPDERLATYVKEHDIVDIELCDALEEEETDDDDDDESEGDEINDDTFPDCDKEDVILCQEITLDETSKDGDLPVTVPDPFNVDTGSQEQYAAVPTLFNVDTGSKEPYEAVGKKPLSKLYVTLNLREAWESGKIARTDYPESHHSTREFQQIRPTLTCFDCCHVGNDHKQVIMVYDDDYVESIRSSTKWWDGVFIGLFAQMASHYTHSTIGERQSAMGSTPLPQVMHVTYPKEKITQEQFVNFPSNVTQLVSVLHESQHYALLDIDIQGRRAVIFDGLNRPVLKWIHHVVSSLKRARLIGINETCNSNETGEVTEMIGLLRGKQVKSSNAYMLSFDVSQEWRLERGHFVKQLDGFDCGPIACTKILEIFGLVTKFEVHNAYGVGNIRTLVVEHWKRFIERCNDDLIIRRVQERRPIAVLREEYAAKAGGGTTFIASTASTFDPLDVCFCFDDESHMDILRLACCKAFIHRECLLSWLEFESSCPYCNSPIEHIASIQNQPAIDRTKGLPSTPPMTPQER